MEQENYVLLTANAGVLISIHHKKILVDALHSTKTQRFSRVPDEVLRRIVNGEGDFDGLDLALYTHDHPDHYSKNWTMRLLERNPNIHLVMPIHDFSDRNHVHILSRPREVLQINGVKITCLRLQHDGSEFASVVNYAYLLDVDGYHILLLGDGLMDPKVIQALLEGCEVDLALLNFPFLTLKRGRDIIDQVIGARKTILFHLPDLEDDINGYGPAAQRTIQKIYQNSPQITLLSRSLEKISIDVSEREKNE